MEKNANYTLVGLFVLLISFCIAGFIFWLGKYGFDNNEYESYKTYITESVSGLKVSAPVKIKGIEVGRVESVMIDRSNPEHIEVVFSVQKGTPVKEDSFAVLASQGIAGLAFLELKGGTKSSKNLRDVDKSACPLIKSDISLLSKLSGKAEDVSRDIGKLILKIDKLLSDKNIQNIEKSIDNLQLLSTELKNNKGEIKKILSGASKLELKTDQAIEKISQTIDKASVTIENSNEMLNDIKGLTNEGKQLVRELKDSPSDILFKQKKPKLGPGE